MLFRPSRILANSKLISFDVLTTVAKCSVVIERTGYRDKECMQTHIPAFDPVASDFSSLISCRVNLGTAFEESNYC